MNFVHGFILAAFLVTSTQSTPFKTCSEGAAPSDVRVDGCTKNPCTLYRGTNATAEWDFIVNEDTKVLKPRVRATVMGATVNYPFPQKNACISLKNAKCPLDAGENVTYQLSMPVLKAYPKIPLTIEFAFLDDKDSVVVCFKLAARVADK
ncbi:PREDICTED: protein NPC2 homolog [Ceratosolen solmsi marchali]|uniref:Protein NPC2 homolog n=1 Tax=Ceratosolen solmsi marchali TaxID=326594 RepID=A0AAJ7E177_9HYME|nr:PREDICTED: protein NPC2 homolog [Ceratosolen solmsi marchali]